MKLTDLTEGLAGHQKRAQRGRALKRVVGPLVNAIIEQRRQKYSSVENSNEQRKAIKQDFPPEWLNPENPIGYRSVERFLKAFEDNEASKHDFFEYIEPFLDEIKQSAFDGYLQYVDTLKDRR